MNNHELLKLAAKAAGIGDVDVAGNPCVLVVNDYGISQRHWNPLTDDGDALRLAVKLGLCVSPDSSGVYCTNADTFIEVAASDYGADPYAATRRAIVRAAAAIGETI